jgi:futalosine hydrolase
MKTLIVAATIFEIKPLLAHFDLSESSLLNNGIADILITGVGMTATAFALGKHLSNNNYELVLNLGIAGSFDKAIPLGSVVNITQDTFAELGAQDKEQFLTIDSLNLGKSKYQATYQVPDELLSTLKRVEAITVNMVHGREDSIALITSRLAPEIESMEGAAVFYCCEQLAIPCLQVRSISNYVEPRNKDAWEMRPAITNLNKWAIDFLTKS